MKNPSESLEGKPHPTDKKEEEKEPGKLKVWSLEEYRGNLDPPWWKRKMTDSYSENNAEYLIYIPMQSTIKKI